MKSAEEILKSKFPNADKIDWFKPIVECINEARLEAIRECANKATISYSACGDISICGCGGDCQHPDTSVNKQSILNLLDQIK